MTLEESIDVVVLFSFLARKPLCGGRRVTEAEAERSLTRLAEAASVMLNGAEPPAECDLTAPAAHRARRPSAN